MANNEPDSFEMAEELEQITMMKEILRAHEGISDEELQVHVRGKYLLASKLLVHANACREQAQEMLRKLIDLRDRKIAQDARMRKFLRKIKKAKKQE